MRKLIKIGNQYIFRLKNLAVDVGLMEGHSGYRKFIILGRARTGSNYLRGLLNSHSQTVVFGEIFRDYDRIDWSLHGYRSNSKKMLSLIQTDPIGFLETQIFRKYSRDTAAVGFKCFYYHAQNESWKPIWAHLRDDSCSVIHIKRKNLLKTYLSEKRAFKTGKWINTSGPEKKDSAISLDFEDCLQKFATIREQEKQYDAFFKDSAKLDVLYEDLSRDHLAETKRIQQFLGVNLEVLNPSTHKQSRRPLSKAISNYLELKEKFENTPWKEFFEETG